MSTFPFSDHCDGRRFFNPVLRARRGFPQVLRWMLTRKKQPWPHWIEDSAQPPPNGELSTGQVALTFINHSSFLIRTGGVNVLTDPIWSERASPFRWAGPRRVRRPGVPFEQLPPIHLVLVSHNHYDHMDLPTLNRLEERFHPLFLTGLGNRRCLMRRGLTNVKELDWWQSQRCHDALTATFTPALHFSRRGWFDENRTLWGGFVLEVEQRRIYFAGDTGYADHFREIRRRLGPIDGALFPFAAYEPRWFMKPAHMNPEEAVQAHLDLGPGLTIGMHFGTFQLTDEGIDEPVVALRKCLRQRGVADRLFRVPEFGETMVIPL
jgi:L-ascorbate metabolism protein UlaG (beta-lactamase superfamily)